MAKVQREIETVICEGITRFEQHSMGPGSKDIHTHIIGDLLLVRLHSVLTEAEQQLVKSFPAEKRKDLLKQVRIQLIETARPVLEAMVQQAISVKTLSLHHDVSTLPVQKPSFSADRQHRERNGDVCSGRRNATRYQQHILLTPVTKCARERSIPKRGMSGAEAYITLMSKRGRGKDSSRNRLTLCRARSRLRGGNEIDRTSPHHRLRAG